MRRRLFIIALAIAVVCIGFGLLAFRKSPSQGNFPAGFSEAERRDILSACRSDAITEMVREVKLGKFRIACCCMHFAALGKVQGVSVQPGGVIHVTGDDGGKLLETNGLPDGYARPNLRTVG